MHTREGFSSCASLQVVVGADNDSRILFYGIFLAMYSPKNGLTINKHKDGSPKESN